MRSHLFLAASVAILLTNLVAARRPVALEPGLFNARIQVINGGPMKEHEGEKWQFYLSPKIQTIAPGHADNNVCDPGLGYFQVFSAKTDGQCQLSLPTETQPWSKYSDYYIISYGTQDASTSYVILSVYCDLSAGNLASKDGNMTFSNQGKGIDGNYIYQISGNLVSKHVCGTNPPAPPTPSPPPFTNPPLHKCSHYSDCGSCTRAASGNCGWCSKSVSCEDGSSLGPNKDQPSCPNSDWTWFYDNCGLDENKKNN